MKSGSWIFPAGAGIAILSTVLETDGIYFWSRLIVGFLFLYFATRIYE
jgi:hypothetical protein